MEIDSIRIRVVPLAETDHNKPWNEIPAGFNEAAIANDDNDIGEDFSGSDSDSE